MKKFILSIFIIISMSLSMALDYPNAYVNSILPSVYKIAIKTPKFKGISYKQFTRLIKSGNCEVVIHLYELAPESQRVKVLMEVARERNVISVTDSLTAEKILRDYEKYFNSLRDKGVPYASRKIDFYREYLAKRISDGEKFTVQDIQRETSQLINGGLFNTSHPVTGILYNEKGFPIFESVYETSLPKELLLAKDYEQFQYATKQLAKQIEADLNSAKKFSPEQIEQIKAGYKPTGYTWHHHEDTGRMQLVETAIHQGTPHRGGKSIWGGGSANR